MKLAAPILLALVAACAQSPDSIAPVSMAGAYDGTSCASAKASYDRERQTLASLSEAQRSARAGDTVGVLLLGVPMSSLTGGDKAGMIAASKGKTIALESRLRSCGAAP